MNNEKVHSKALKTRPKALGILDPSYGPCHLVLLQKEEIIGEGKYIFFLEEKKNREGKRR